MIRSSHIDYHRINCNRTLIKSHYLLILDPTDPNRVLKHCPSLIIFKTLNYYYCFKLYENRIIYFFNDIPNHPNAQNPFLVSRRRAHQSKQHKLRSGKTHQIIPAPNPSLSLQFSLSLYHFTLTLAERETNTVDLKWRRRNQTSIQFSSFKNNHGTSYHYSSRSVTQSMQTIYLPVAASSMFLPISSVT